MDHAPSAPAPEATRQRLLDAAGPVFALRGFQHATVREICDAAGANIAAVNYHFGDKLGLYHACIESFYANAMAAFPPTGGLSPTAPAEERLRGFIASFIERLTGDGPNAKPAWLSQIIVREMAEPTGVFQTLCDGYMRPQFMLIVGIVAEPTGLPPDSLRAKQCAMSVISQCIFHRVCRAAIACLAPEQGYAEPQRRALVDHITRFSLAGLRAVKESTP